MGFFKLAHSLNCPVVVFHIFLWNVCSLFQYCKAFFIYIYTRPSPSRPFICFVFCFFPFFPHVLISSKWWSRSNQLSSLSHSQGFVDISHIFSSIFEINVYSIIDSNVFSVKIGENFLLTIVKERLVVYIRKISSIKKEGIWFYK